MLGSGRGETTPAGLLAQAHTASWALTAGVDVYSRVSNFQHMWFRPIFLSSNNEADRHVECNNVDNATME